MYKAHAQMRVVFKQAFCMFFINMYHFRSAPSISHSIISKFKIVVAAVSWVLVLNMCLWHGFWARQIRQTRFELTIVTRDVLRHFSNHRARGPIEGKGEALLFSFQLLLSVISWRVDSWDS